MTEDKIVPDMKVIGADGVHQLALLQDDLTVGDAQVTAPDEPLRPGSKGRRLLTA